MSLPLDGVRVVSLGVSISGPLGVRHLADFGAEVIKVEPPGGDMVRHWDSAVGGEGSVHFWVNPNKRSVVLNLKDERGREVLRRLIAGADIFLENFSPGTAGRLGFGYEAVRRIRPDIIYLHASGYGQDGPYRDMKAFDGLIQAETGVMEMTGAPESPAKVALSICDGVTGLFIALSAMMALRQRDRTGAGQEVDVSMFDCMTSMLGYFPLRHFYEGYVPHRVGLGHHLLAPYGAYPAKGGQLIALACANEATWHRFAEAMGHAEWKDEARFRDNASRYAHRAVLEEAFLPVLAAREREEWRQVFLDKGVPCACVNSLAEVCEHPQTRYRDLFPEVVGPYGRIRLGRFPVRFSGLAPRLVHPPKTSADTAAVLRELGMDDKEIAALREGGIIA
jgi:crotonobetainyl-CoA:carnitine CoA-transferase CaiB-like acyl-CoA transferase